MAEWEATTVSLVLLTSIHFHGHSLDCHTGLHVAKAEIVATSPQTHRQGLDNTTVLPPRSRTAFWIFLLNVEVSLKSTSRRTWKKSLSLDWIRKQSDKQMNFQLILYITLLGTPGARGKLRRRDSEETGNKKPERNVYRKPHIQLNRRADVTTNWFPCLKIPPTELWPGKRINIFLKTWVAFSAGN